MKNLNPLNKVVIALAGALAVAAPIVSDNNLSLSDIVAVVAAFVSGLAIYPASKGR